MGKVPEILYTRDIEDAFVQGLQRCVPGAEVWVISPYNTIDKLGTIRRAIIKACKDGVRVKHVVRDEPPQVDGAKQSLSEAMENGLDLFALERMHAKLYWFEDSCAIVTSANMVDASFDKSTELGLCVPVGGLFGELRKWVNDEVIPMPDVSDWRPVQIRQGHRRRPFKRRTQFKRGRGMTDSVCAVARRSVEQECAILP